MERVNLLTHQEKFAGRLHMEVKRVLLQQAQDRLVLRATHGRIAIDVYLVLSPNSTVSNHVVLRTGGS